MALALYRKYRPRTFAEVIGQEHVTEPLSQALRSGRLHHAYLFSGPRGCGKTSSARILARSLNCEQGPTPEPCGQCASCRSLTNDGAGSIDVIEIDAASHGGVDDARELREKAFFAPVSSRYKIYVIDEAHMVSSAGFNALLKLVEEPPDYVKFVFATTEPDKVLGTIRSRTHHYPFRLIPPAMLRPYLAQLCEAEGVRVDPAVFPLVVRAGGGSARDTLSVLDQLIAGAGPEGVDYARAVALLGVTDVALLDEMCDSLAAGDGAAAYATIDRVAEAGHDPRRFAADLLERLRDLIVLQQVPDAAAKGLIDGPADQIERMTGQARRLGPATLSRAADIVHNGLVEMRGTTAPRLLLELITARMLLPAAEDSTGALLQRLERMERRLTLPADPGGSAGHDPAPIRPKPAPEATPAPEAAPPAPEATPPAPDAAPPAPEATPPAPDAAPPAGAAAPAAREPAPDPSPVPGGCPAAAGQPSAPAVRDRWPDIVSRVGRKSKKIAALAQGATVADLDGRTVVLSFRFPAHARMVASQPELLAEALAESLGGQWQIRCEAAGEAAVPGRSTASPRSAAQPAPAPRAAGAPASATGQRAGAPASAAPSDDWPEPVRPGGSAPTPSVAHPPVAHPPVAQAPVAQSLAAQSPAAQPAQRAAAASSSAEGPRTKVSSAGLKASRVADGSVRNVGSGTWSDGSPAEEPPYDPDYDGPVRGATPPTYEGFDPGDEPLDHVVDEKAARQSSEQQAVQLLRDAFGAEKIGES